MLCTLLVSGVKAAQNKRIFSCSFLRQRPYHVESTSSRPITEVKQRRARLVLGWVTAWESRVLLTFLLDFILANDSTKFCAIPPELERIGSILAILHPIRLSQQAGFCI